MIKGNSYSAWRDFKSTGLYWFINSILQMFGWTLKPVEKDGFVIGLYPEKQMNIKIDNLIYHALSAFIKTNFVEVKQLMNDEDGK